MKINGLLTGNHETHLKSRRFNVYAGKVWRAMLVRVLLSVR